MAYSLKALAASFLLFAASLPAHANFSSCRQFFPQGEPPANITRLKALHELCFENFAVLYSGESKTPVYVAERLNKELLLDAKDERRTDKFYEEARLPKSHRATLKDYAKSGFDRGHMAPAANQPNAKAMAQSFSLANMVPQAPEHNRGPWADIEQATRKFVMRAKGDVLVFTGPVYEGTISAVGLNKVWVPSSLYKVVYDTSTKKAWVYWLANKNGVRATTPWSYDQFVQRTGMNLLRLPLN